MNKIILNKDCDNKEKLINKNMTKHKSMQFNSKIP